MLGEYQNGGAKTGVMEPAATRNRRKAGVTSDARQVTSARSADRFKGFQSFPAGVFSGVSFGLKITHWCLFPLKTSRLKGLGQHLIKIWKYFSTLSLEHGMDVKALSTIIGHVSSNTTLNVYAHTEEVCEKLLAEIIAHMKREITVEKKRLVADPIAS